MFSLTKPLLLKPRASSVTCIGESIKMRTGRWQLIRLIFRKALEAFKALRAFHWRIVKCCADSEWKKNVRWTNKWALGMAAIEIFAGPIRFAKRFLRQRNGEERPIFARSLRSFTSAGSVSRTSTTWRGGVGSFAQHVERTAGLRLMAQVLAKRHAS